MQGEARLYTVKCVRRVVAGPSLPHSSHEPDCQQEPFDQLNLAPYAGESAILDDVPLSPTVATV